MCLCVFVFGDSQTSASELVRSVWRLCSCMGVVERFLLHMCDAQVIKNNKDFLDQSLDEIKLLRYINAVGDPDEHNVLRLYEYFYHKEHLCLVTEVRVLWRRWCWWWCVHWCGRGCGRMRGCGGVGVGSGVDVGTGIVLVVHAWTTIP